MHLEASGKADLVKETFDLLVNPKAVATIKGQRDEKARAGILVPIIVSGTFAEPQFKPDIKRIITQVDKGILESKPAKKNLEKEEYQDLIQSIRDGGDMALAELEETTIYSYVKLKVQELDNIEEPLRQIENGKYGRCRDCGIWIRTARLKVVPYAVRCLSCQEKLERLASV